MELEVKDTNFEKPHIKEGLYDAEFKMIKDIVDGQYGQRVALIFDVFVELGQKPIELSLVCYKKLTMQSSLGKALASIGARVTTGQTVSTDKLLGAACRVLVASYTGKDGQEASIIDKVLPASDATLKFIADAKALAPNGSIVEVETL